MPEKSVQISKAAGPLQSLMPSALSFALVGQLGWCCTMWPLLMGELPLPLALPTDRPRSADRPRRLRNGSGQKILVPIPHSSILSHSSSIVG